MRSHSNLNSIAQNASGTTSQVPIILSKISLLLMVVESAIGLFAPGMYAKDSTWGRAVFLGNDLINLFLFTPLLIIALILLKRGTDKDKVFWLGIQALVTYDYVYYPLAVAYNQYFLLYLSILGISLYSFIFGINTLDLPSYKKYIPAKCAKVTASVLLLAFALVFVFLWIGRYVSFLITGKLDMDGVSMISTFDLVTLAVPLVLSAIWLIR